MKARATSAALASGLLWIIILVCCALPLVWIVGQVIGNPHVLVEARLDAFRLALLGRTLSYNGCVALVATLLGLPAAIVLGRGRGWVARLLTFALPIALLLPSITYAYGWSQFTRLMAQPLGSVFGHFLQAHVGVAEWLGVSVRDDAGTLAVFLSPAGRADVARCAWTLATWLCALPAGIIGLALRRVDAQVQQQALLDGVLWRVTLRQLAPAIVAAASIAMILAVQEFAVYEPTGISVTATEVRMVFETGAFSSPTNPITAPMGAQGIQPVSLADQASRAGAAVATSLPLLGAIIVLAILAFRVTRRLSINEQLEIGTWPRSLDAGPLARILALAVFTIAVLVPAASLVVSRRGGLHPLNVWETFRPQVTGSLIVAALAGVAGLVIALLAIVRRDRVLIAVALASFVVGGQLLAIAQIRLYNRPGLRAVYDAWPIVVITYVARFGWVALIAAGATWSRAWRDVRDMASIDGASPAQSARSVVAPLAWPVLGAAGVLVMSLALVEVPATVLLSPQRPQMLIPMLMTWVHMLRYDSMIEGSLLMMGVVSVLAGAALVMVWFFVRERGWRIEDRGLKMEHGRWRKTTRALSILSLLSAIVLLTGCERGNVPEEIWCDTGTGPAQVVYPRGITYSRADDTFFIVDRMARVQHLDRSGKFLNDWRMPDWKIGKPTGLSVGPDGDVYVADTHYQRVMVYSPQGKLLRHWGSPGKGPGQFIYPTDIAFDSFGRIFVSEYGDNDRIQVFDDHGNFLYTFGHFGNGDGEFSRPQSMVIDGDTLYVTDACNHRVAVFKTDGTFVRNMGHVGSGLGEFRFPYGLDEDDDGHLIVCEFGNNRVQMIDKMTGKGLKAWGAGGREPGQLAYPWAVAVDRKDRIVTVDAGNNRLQVFEF